jgi:hypothetical protein
MLQSDAMGPKQAITELEAEKSRLKSGLAVLRRIDGARTGTSSPSQAKLNLSAAARSRIPAAARARWAKIKDGKKK